MNTCFTNLAKDYYAIAMGNTPDINVNWSSGLEDIEDCKSWITRLFDSAENSAQCLQGPEALKDEATLIWMADELHSYTEEYQEFGFIKGFITAMELMKDRSTERRKHNDR